MNNLKNTIKKMMNEKASLWDLCRKSKCRL